MDLGPPAPAVALDPPAPALPAASSSIARAPLGFADWLGLLIATGASAVVYYPLLENHFVGDDFLNLYRILNCGFWEYILTPHGGHTLVARNLFFYLCELAFGTEPAGYFWVVLLTHLANVAVLFVVIRRMTGSTRLAWLGAALWGTSPVHDGALGWYAVYGHVMAATAMLLILYGLLGIDAEPANSPSKEPVMLRDAPHGAPQHERVGVVRSPFPFTLRRRAAPSRRATLLGCYILALIGTVSFGVGIGIAMVLPFVIALLAPSTRPFARWGIPLLSLLVVVPSVYVGLFAVNGFFFSEGIETPGLVAQSVFQLWNIVIPNTIHLMSYGVMRLLTAFWFDPGWVTPTASYTVFGIFTAATLIAAWAAPIELRRAMAAGALLALGCYGCIAMGRVAFFQVLTSALMAIQPRYHYAGLVPFTLLVCLILASAGRLRIIPALAKNIALVAALGLMAAAYRTSEFQVDHHIEARVQLDEVMTSVMSSVAAAQMGDDVYIPNRSFAGFFMLAPTVFPGWAAVFAIYHPTNVVEGRHVYFVDKRLGVLIASAKGKRSARLIVPPPSKDDQQ